MVKRMSIFFIALVIIALLWVGAEVVCDQIDGRFNRVLDPGPYKVSEAARALHHQSFVADLHADPLLWSRNLLKRARHGQVDLPRLVEGGVGLQVFGVVTKTPEGQNFVHNASNSDRLTKLFVVRRAPPRVWFSVYERALYQAQRLNRSVARSNGRLRMLLTRGDLEHLLAERAESKKIVGALLSLEGTHALEGKRERLQDLFDAGFRMIGLAHFFDNEFAGSAHGMKQGGLSDLGRWLVDESQRLGMVIDLAHASTATLHEVAKMVQRPVVVSHTGVRGTCESPRNLHDEDLKAVAATGGVVGIAFFRDATCGDDLESILRAIEYAVGVVGADHVGLGSDFDGAITAPMDTRGMPLITEGLLERGFSNGDIQKILGGNVERVLRQTLPVG